MKTNRRKVFLLVPVEVEYFQAESGEEIGAVTSPTFDQIRTAGKVNDMEYDSFDEAIANLERLQRF